jgi:RNA polymerase sigma-70 factor (TIGR02960 family)
LDAGRDTGPEREFTDEFPARPVSVEEMTEATLTRARAGDETAFRALTDPYRRELQLHCYRMLGSVQDAEDLVQETLLAAWRGLDRFEGRSSVRTWLYRIATNRCLNALRDSGRRPAEVPRNLPVPTRVTEPIWLEPYPDSLLGGIPDAAPGPEARYETKESVALAFVTGLQHLPPRQRAVLVLKDVLGFSAAEVAELVDSSEPSVNSALQRARTGLSDRIATADRDRAPLPDSAAERDLVSRFADAFAANDVERVVALMTDDAVLSMPPEPVEYEGRETIDHFFRQVVFAGGRRTGRLVATRANGQPAFGYYVADEHGAIVRCYGVLVLTLAGERISAITRFGDTGVLPFFGLPRKLPS